MTRIKTVFPTSEVFHLWANRAHKHDIRNASGNVSTRNCGAVLCSYGSHFAIGGFFYHPKNENYILLMNDGNYSVTTSKHQTQARYAMPSYLRESAIYVPALNLQSFYNAASMCDVARDCIKSAAQSLSKSDKARQNRPYLIGAAIRSLEAARKIYEFVDAKKQAAAIPTIPADADKAAILSVLRVIGAAENMRHAAAKLESARRDHETLVSAIEFFCYVDGIGFEYNRKPAGRILDIGRRVESYCNESAQYYKQAGRKAAPELARMLQHAKQAAAEFKAAFDAEIASEQAARIRELARDTIRELAQYRRGNTRGAMYYAGRLREFRGIDIPADVSALVSRAMRILNASALISAISEAGRYSAQFDPTAQSYSIPTASHIRKALVLLANENPRMIPAGGYWQNRADALIATIETQRAECNAMQAARYASAIEAWRTGGRVSLPSNVPTMARIRGDIVETSRGASVPLDHAVRLVRIAERIAARGGSHWDNGTGPIVGHYRVQSIGADFSAVIGCHEFTAAESARIIAAIKESAAYTGAESATV